MVAIGAATGALSDSLNAATIIIVILTTFMAPPLLQLAFSRSEESTPVEGELVGELEPGLVERNSIGLSLSQ